MARARMSVAARGLFRQMSRKGISLVSRGGGSTTTSGT